MLCGGWIGVETSNVAGSVIRWIAILCRGRGEVGVMSALDWGADLECGWRCEWLGSDIVSG